jgi:DNA polymerase-1
VSRPPRVYLIDGYSVIFRAFYAIRHLSNSRGEPTNAVYGFLNIVRKLLREEAPELVGVALDVSRKTVRSERYAEYKANRKPMPEDLRPQIPRIRELLEAYRIPILELADYEADDVIGTLAAKAHEAGYEVVIVSADKDLFQLVRPGVSLLHTGREKLYGPAEVEEDFGVPPQRVVDVLALMGDTSDNVPGVPGIGEKSALQLIREHGDLDTLLAKANEIGRKAWREKLIEHRELAELSRELVTIHTDLPIDFDAVDLRLDPPDARKLAELFARLEFWSLLEEAQREASSARRFEPAEEASGEQLAEALATAGGQAQVAWLGTAEVVAVAARHPDGRVLVADVRVPEHRRWVREALVRLFAEPTVEVVCHDAKELLRFAGVERPRAQLFDTMLVSYVLRPSTSHTLPTLALEGLAYRMSTNREAGLDDTRSQLLGDARLSAAAGEHVGVLEELTPKLAAELAARPALERLYREIEAPLVAVLLAMERAGITVDVGFLRGLSSELGERVGALEERIYLEAGTRFVIGSPQQLGEVLFEKLGYPVLKRTKKTRSYATDAEVLEELAARGLPVAALVQEWRELTKLVSTWIDSLPNLVDAEGRVHTTYLQAVAATGRLSSANPNLQNIPVRTELGQRLRRAFIAPPGFQLLVADYSQIELRVLAHISGDEAMVEAFRQGEDIHRATAARVLGIHPDMVGPDQRRAAKVVNFGIVYGMTAYGLAKTLGVAPREAKGFIDAYFERYPGVKRYIDTTIEAAHASGRVETELGRVRFIPELAAKNRMVRENAERMAINARIQGTAADLLKLAMLRIDRALEAQGGAARLLLTVHDELVLEVPQAEAEAVRDLVLTEMAAVATLSVPLVVEAGIGPSWYEAKA